MNDTIPLLNDDVSIDIQTIQKDFRITFIHYLKYVVSQIESD
jgi:hypothetical protein